MRALSLTVALVLCLASTVAAIEVTNITFGRSAYRQELPGSTIPGESFWSNYRCAEYDHVAVFSIRKPDGTPIASETQWVDGPHPVAGHHHSMSKIVTGTETFDAPVILRLEIWDPWAWPVPDTFAVEQLVQPAN